MRGAASRAQARPPTADNPCELLQREQKGTVSATVSKFKCGKCFQGYDELQAFGDHPCPGDNAFLAAVSGIKIRMPGFTMDFTAVIAEALRRKNIESAIANLEKDIRQTDR